MSGSTIIFYLLAVLTLGSGMLAVTAERIFRSAIFLLFSLIGMAGLYFWLDYQFIAAVQTVVYAGGIAVLIIFSIFLTQQAGDKMPRQTLGKKLFAALAVFCGFAVTLLQIASFSFSKTTAPAIAPTVRNIGEHFLSVDRYGYALPFEVISMLLLAAMIGCIVIAMKEPATGLHVQAGPQPAATEEGKTQIIEIPSPQIIEK